MTNADMQYNIKTGPHRSKQVQTGPGFLVVQVQIKPTTCTAASCSCLDPLSGSAAPLKPLLPAESDVNNPQVVFDQH